METNTVQIIELLSLEARSASFYMTIRVTRNEGRTECVLEIDEPTYIQLIAVNPSDGERIRLSLHPKWDPYRHIYYSMVIKVNGDFNETLYFTCSEFYMDQLKRLKEDEDIVYHPMEAARQQAVKTRVAPKAKKQAAGVWRRGPFALKLAIFTLLAAAVMMGMEGKLLSDSQHAMNPPVNAAELAVRQDNASSMQEQAAPVAAANEKEPLLVSQTVLDTSPEAEKRQLYERLRIDADKFTYGVPKGYVALTFDDGPSVYTKQIVDILIEEKVAASFLFVGKKAQQYPDAVAYADDQGMSIGNHSWDHTKLTAHNQKSYKTNIHKANKTLEATTKEPVTIFRPPYGAITAALAANVLDEDMKVLMWNRDPEDWKADKPEDILRYFHKVDPSGGIYVLHEKAATVEALPDIIQYLKDQQLTFIIFN